MITIRGRTLNIEIPTDLEQRKIFLHDMEQVAKDLTALTGFEIKFHDATDNMCAVYGDFGFFIVQKIYEPYSTCIINDKHLAIMDGKLYMNGKLLEGEAVTTP
jgi:hypothetical protein